VRTQTRLRHYRLEEFNRVARGVFQENLLATDTGNDVVAEVGARLAQPLYGGGEVVNFEREAVPPARLRSGAVGHGLSTSARWIGGAEDETQIAAREHRKGGRRVHLKLEAKVLRIERNGGLHIVDDIADLNGSHVVVLPSSLLEGALSISWLKHLFLPYLKTERDVKSF
jgi:hypothetical protein